MKEFLAKYGKVLDKAKDKRLGLTLKASAAATVKDYGLPLTPDQYIQQIIPMYQQKYVKFSHNALLAYIIRFSFSF